VGSSFSPCDMRLCKRHMKLMYVRHPTQPWYQISQICIYIYICVSYIIYIYTYIYVYMRLVKRHIRLMFWVLCVVWWYISYIYIYIYIYIYMRLIKRHIRLMYSIPVLSQYMYWLFWWVSYTHIYIYIYIYIYNVYHQKTYKTQYLSRICLLTSLSCTQQTY